MVTNLAKRFDCDFEHKAGYLATHDWRPREYNKTADLLCNIALDNACNLRQQFVPSIADLLGQGASLQIYSDGGLRGSSGAAAFAAFVVDVANASSLTLVLVDAIHLEAQDSAFAMEVIAADRAIQAAVDIGKQWRAAQTDPRFKRQRIA